MQHVFGLAFQTSQLMEEFFGIISDVLRPEATVHDVSLVFELVAAVKAGSPERARQLR